MKQFTSRKHLLTVTIAVAAVGVGLALMDGLGFAGAKRSPLGPPSGDVLAALSHASHALAAANGESHPTDGQVVESTRRVANEQANGAEIPDDSPVYVVTLHGRFTGIGPRPAEAPAPQGTVLTLVFDPANLQVLDLTISRHAPALTQLGSVEQLP